jgi:hypothetical protein
VLLTVSNSCVSSRQVAKAGHAGMLVSVAQATLPTLAAAASLAEAASRSSQSVVEHDSCLMINRAADFHSSIKSLVINTFSLHTAGLMDQHQSP